MSGNRTPEQIADDLISRHDIEGERLDPSGVRAVLIECARESQTLVPAFAPAGEPDIYREIDARLITSSGQFEVNISGDYGSHSGPLVVTSEQTRRILVMLSAEASR
jgi:hypothetical protein